MTNERRAVWIKRVLMLLLAAGVVAGVYFYPEPKVEAPPAAVVSPENGLALVHYHLPGNSESESLAEVLDRVQTKYGKLVVVSRVDLKLHPERAKEHAVTRPPHVIIISGTEKVFEFQGPWTQSQVEQKVDEILRGLKRVGKDWRPVVKGMTPASG